jgi:murein DD-endopeptidase MepM/ murein hydrolase activator NlpD
MKHKAKKILLLIVFLALGLENFSYSLKAQENPSGISAVAPLTSSTAFTQQELENLIKIKSQELEKINRELETTQGNLESVKNQKLTLQRELQSLQNNIKQLELNIQADELVGQKLGLEIDSLNYDIRNIGISIDNKKEAIVSILREFQRNDRTALFIVFLKNRSLADGVLESQSLKNLKSQLSIDIANLAELHSQLNNKVQQVNDKKADIELHRQNLSYRKIIAQDQKEERTVILAQTKNKESLYEQQLKELRKQQEAIADEISKIEDQLRASFDVNLLPIKRPGVFAWPVPLVKEGGKGIITQHFGEISYLYAGKPHNGLDIGIPVGTPVMAADDGVVLAVDNNDRNKWNKYQYGKYILLRHNNNLATLYAHLSQQLVEKGMVVKRGEIIGYSDTTGYATGPHLHFGAYWAPSILLKSVPPAAGLVPVGVVINPEDYL